MNPALSRADLLRLLRLLEQAPQAGQVAAAAMLGWEYQADSSEPTGNPPLRPPTGPAIQAPTSGDLHYLARRPPRYWRVVECRPEAPTDDDQADKAKAGELTASGAPPPHRHRTSPFRRYAVPASGKTSGTGCRPGQPAAAA